MSDLNTLFDKIYWVVIWTIAVAVAIVKTISKPRCSYHAYIVAFFSGLISSVLFCYLGAEITLYFTGSERFGLAVGGFFTWQGGDWIKTVCEKILDSKLGLDDK